MNIRHELGRMAEDRAAEYLQSLGWKILGRNIRNHYGELDIVAIENVLLTPAAPFARESSGECQRELVIVEVRCRTVGKIQSPIESIGPRKLQKLMCAGEALTIKLNWSGFWRIDVVGFTVPLKRSEPWKLEHVRDITSGLFL